MPNLSTVSMHMYKGLAYSDQVDRHSWATSVCFARWCEGEGSHKAAWRLIQIRKRFVLKAYFYDTPFWLGPGFFLKGLAKVGFLEGLAKPVALWSPGPWSRGPWSRGLWSSGPAMNPLRTRHSDVVFANGGGCPPPNPPAVFLSRAGLLSRTSHPEQDLHQTRNCFRAFQNSS